MLRQTDFRGGRHASDSSASHVTKRDAELVQVKSSAMRCPLAFLGAVDTKVRISGVDIE
jgi:hypothetical protein